MQLEGIGVNFIFDYPSQFMKESKGDEVINEINKTVDRIKEQRTYHSRLQRKKRNHFELSFSTFDLIIFSFFCEISC